MFFVCCIGSHAFSNDLKIPRRTGKFTVHSNSLNSVNL